MAIKIIIRKKEYTFEKSLSVKQALTQLNLPSESYLAMRSKELITEDTILKDGDVVELVAVISGGSTR